MPRFRPLRLLVLVLLASMTQLPPLPPPLSPPTPPPLLPPPQPVAGLLLLLLLPPPPLACGTLESLEPLAFAEPRTATRCWCWYWCWPPPTCFLVFGWCLLWSMLRSLLRLRCPAQVLQLVPPEQRLVALLVLPRQRLLVPPLLLSPANWSGKGESGRSKNEGLAFQGCALDHGTFRASRRRKIVNRIYQRKSIYSIVPHSGRAL